MDINRQIVTVMDTDMDKAIVLHHLIPKLSQETTYNT